MMQPKLNMISACLSCFDFGNELQVKGCLFHFDQAVLKKIREYGLFEYYKKDENKFGKDNPIRKWLQALKSLPLLPPSLLLLLSKTLLYFDLLNDAA